MFFFVSSTTAHRELCGLQRQSEGAATVRASRFSHYISRLRWGADSVGEVGRDLRLALVGCLLAAILLIALSVSAQAQQLELDVDGASLTRSYDGHPAISVTLSEKSRLAFAAFTAASVGRLHDYRLNGDVLTKMRPQTSIIGGRFELAGPVIDQRAVEIVEKLLSKNATLDVRTIDEKR